MRAAASVTDRPLARTVLSRQRHARIIGLGDRRAPGAFTPGLILTPDESADIALAPFVMTHDATTLPARLELTARGPWAYPFEAEDIPVWQAAEGHTLPPSLDDADSGMGQSSGALLPLTWQRLVHDHALVDPALDPEVIVLLDAMQLANHPGRLVEALHTIRCRFPGALLHTPGIGGPDNAAVLAWFGVDLFDLTRAKAAATHGLLLTMAGPRHPEPTAGEPAADDFEALLAANVDQWRLALAQTRAAIRTGDLRELVEAQSLNSPRLVEHLRRHDALIPAGENTPLEMHVNARRVMRCHSPVSREDPLIRDWVHRIRHTYMPPENQRKVMVLLPCSARKPYSSSKSHGFFRRAIRNRGIHQVIVTSPLGLVPRELEEQWPAAHYDVPVTGDWDLGELDLIRGLIRDFAKRIGHVHIINHSGIDLSDLDLSCTVEDTRAGGGGASSREACARLSEAIERAAEAHEVANMGEKHWLAEQMASVSRWLYGTDAWIAGLRMGGRPPRWLILEGKQQMAQWHPSVGRIAFSKSLLPRLAEHDVLRRIELKSEVTSWRGDIFRAMVESAPNDIRVGEDLLVYRDGALIGSARAEAAGWEWNSAMGRLAKSQHRLG